MATRKHASHSFVVALDLGGTKLGIALVDRAGVIRKQESEPTRLASRADCLRQLVGAVKRARQWAAGDVVAVGICVPGLVRRDGTVWAPNLPGWKRVPVERYLSRATGLPVAAESDRNASVIGEAWQGAARGAEDAIFLIIGTGIGAGILSGGRLVRGANELSGCAGWLVMSERTNQHGEALRFLEALAAGPAIGKAGAQALRRRGATAKDVIEAARHGHVAARRVIETAARHLGLAVADMISLFNPQVVVLGGGVGTSGATLLGPLRRTALRWAQPLAARQVRIVASRLGGRAPLLGMARLAWNLAPPSASDKKL